ncbi:probable protein phosphatase 2C 2 [Impatiens glandulifera]|uniref:probable protein phosphatase 2C 2 n=1 Tax=Impatiens glandulifera TaxID=253017 RepID=UPI001FB0CFDC|nr:probable protein phosphatase 2C 2 [Impatiens glandulifera]
MIDLQEFLSFHSIVSLLLRFLIRGFRKSSSIHMSCVTLTSPQPLSAISHEITKKPRIEGGENMGMSNDGVNIGKNCNRDHMQRSLKMLKRRPSMLVVPDCDQQLHEEFELFNEIAVKKKEMIMNNYSYDHNVVHEVEGRGFLLATSKGTRKETMEDRYGVMLDVMGNPKQAFFTVIDGHGGEAAADFVSQNLGKNIVKELKTTIFDEFKIDSQVTENAIRRGYLETDTQFLNKNLNGGACATSVLIKNGQVYVANAGDCRVVLSRNGVAHLLTLDHRLTREDECIRIQNSGGYVQCWNGVWRVNGSLAVSRAIGDGYLKQWVISDPEIKTFSLTSSDISKCDFLILASDGLWDKVTGQEAVDAVMRDSARSGTKALLDMSRSRGCRDDITVMLVDLQPFF